MSVPPRRPWPARLTALGLTLALVGCDQPTGSTRPRSRVTPVHGIDQAAAPQAPTPPAPPAEDKFIVGKRTQDIRDASKERKAGGVEKAPRIVAKDPITLQGNAYVSIIGQTAQLSITKALDLYQAETGEYPKTYDEFMEKIIKANSIALPKLPFYQEYAYDAPTHKLIIMEYPDRKEAANYPK